MNIILAITTILLIIILSPVILLAGFFILVGIISFIVFIICLIAMTVEKISDFSYKVTEKCKKQMNKKKVE